MPQTLGETPKPPVRVSDDTLDLSSGVVKKPSVSTASDSLDLSAGLVPRKSKLPGKHAPEAKTGLWDKVWTGIVSPETATKAITFGAGAPVEKFSAEADKARKEGRPVAAAYDELSAFAASGNRAAGEVISSLTSPGQLGLMALTAGSSEAEQAGMKVLSKAMAAPGRAIGVWFGAQGLKIAATPQQPGESKYDAFWRQTLGLSAFMGTAHSEWTSAKGSFQGFLKKQFNLNDDLASKVSSQVQAIDQVRKQTAGSVATIDAATSTKIKALQDSLQEQLKDIQQASSTRISAIRGQAEAAIEQSKGKLTDLQQQRLRTGANTVADTMQAFLQEKARVGKPFDDIAAKIKGSVAEPADVKLIITKAFGDTGLKEDQIPPRALELLKPRGGENVGQGNVRMRTPDGHYLEVDADKVHWFTEKGYDVVEKEGGDGRIKFETLTRIREDLGQAANSVKDTAVKRALFKASDDVTDFQEAIAKKHKLGEEYRKAKDGYRQFIRGIGSDMVHTFLDASDAEAQALAPKLAELTTKQNAEALRTVLKAAGVDVKPLDRVLADIKTVDEQIGETKRLAGTMASQQEKSARGSAGEIKKDVSKEIDRTKTEGDAASKTAAKSGQREEAEIKKDEVVPEQDVETLTTKSNRELLEARIRHQMTNSHATGFVNTWAMSSIIYGLMKIAEGSTFGVPIAAVGYLRMDLPQRMKNKGFQDWVIRQSGMDPAVPAASRMRRGLEALAPVLRKALKTGVPQAAAVKAAQGLGDVPAPPTR
jgi:ElaB/YqjD/DUF883 family membrane-anchored ribosome-binding protein